MILQFLSGTGCLLPTTLSAGPFLFCFIVEESDAVGGSILGKQATPKEQRIAMVSLARDGRGFLNIWDLKNDYTQKDN